MQRRKPLAALQVPAGEPARDAQITWPPERSCFRVVGERPEFLLAELDECGERVLRRRGCKFFRIVADGVVDDGAAVARAGRGVDFVERLKAQDIAGVDRVGIAQPVLDRGDREPRRPRCNGRRRRRPQGRPHRRRLVERARQRNVLRAAFGHGLPAFLAGECGEALHETRGHGRRAGDLLRPRQHDLRHAERLREVMRGQADAPLRRIEAELPPHRPAEPGIAARFRRPARFVQSAEHDAVDRLKARFERTVDVHAHVAHFRAAYDAVTDGRMKHFDVVAGGQRKAGSGRRRDDVLEGARQRHAVVIVECGGDAVGIARQRLDRLAVRGRELRQRMIAARQRLQRRQRCGELADQRASGAELVLLDQPARIAAVHVAARRAERVERMRQTFAPGFRPWPTQQRALEHRDGMRLRAVVLSEPQQRMLEQREQRDRFKTFERRLGGQACEGPGLRVGERIAAGIVDRHAPAFERRGDAPCQRAVRGHQRGALGRRLHRLAQTNGDGERFLLGVGGLDQRQSGDCGVGIRFECSPRAAQLPVLGRRRRTQRLRDQRLARRRLGKPHDLVAVHADAREQRLHGELRMPRGGQAVMRLVAVLAGDHLP